jgi:hypothetical protein
MLKRYGEKALEESAARVGELAADGDHDGAVVSALAWVVSCSRAALRHR